MKNTKLVLPVLLLLAVSLSCRLLDRATSKKTSTGPAIDVVTPGKGLNVTVVLDKKQTATAMVPRTGGSVSLTAKDGSEFRLDVPADALEADTTITMTAVKSLDGAPLDNNTPTAVQLEPSGLFFKEMATLTIVPGKDIPIKEQVIFGYEGDGKDYHLALVDPKSKEIRIKLMRFSGAGVGSAGDEAWAANIMVQASTEETRLRQKLGEYLQRHRQKIFWEGEDSVDYAELVEKINSATDQYEEAVVRKQMVAAELDCRHAGRAMQTILGLGHQKEVAGLKIDRVDMWAKVNKLAKIAKECKKAYRVSGESNGVTFSGQICLNKPFVINATFPGGGSAKTSFTPSSVLDGTTSVSGGGAGCVQTGEGKYYAAIKDDASGTLTWTTTDTLSCLGVSRTKTGSFSLPLQPAPEITCP
jgi:hypothetical protein